MSEKREKSIPSWQREDAPSLSSGTEHDAEDRAAPSDTSRASVIEKATRSLQDGGMQDAPIERKKALLKSKGLSDSEIDELVGVSRIVNDPSDAAGKAQVNYKWACYTCCKYHTDPMFIFQLGNKSPNDGEGKSEEEKPPLPKRPSLIPPIITYPEFLLRTRKPPPLVTVGNLLTSLYIISGATATAYGSSNYIVKPMIESLNEARHSLFDTANANLKNLVEKLEQVVSAIPPSISPSKSLLREEDDDDGDSSNSEPTEWFQRSAATQTSPLLSRSTSSITAEKATSESLIQKQQLRLQMLHDSLSDVLHDHKYRLDTSSRVSKQYVDNLQKYLSDMAYGTTFAPAELPVGGDSVSRMKAEIRSVKGVLLSARNFP